MTNITISGKVIHGNKYGRQLGFPTANLDRRQYSRSKMHVRLGVWSGWAGLGRGKACRAAIVIGPVDKGGLPKLEAHVIGYAGNLYGRKISITLQTYLRPFKKFKNEQDLKRQIKKDILFIKTLTWNKKRNPVR